MSDAEEDDEQVTSSSDEERAPKIKNPKPVKKGKPQNKYQMRDSSDDKPGPSVKKGKPGKRSKRHHEEEDSLPGAPKYKKQRKDSEDKPATERRNHNHNNFSKH